jgi:hypothetical protein
MLNFIVLFLLTSALGASATGDFFGDDVKLDLIPPHSQHMEYMFEGNATVTFIGVPQGTAGGQKDLKSFDRLFLHTFNKLQPLTPEQETAEQEPDLLAYDTDVSRQTLSSITSDDGTVTWCNSISLHVSLMCDNEGCPNEDTRRQRKLGRRLKDIIIADIILSKLLKDGRKYFAGVKCVRISTSPDSVDESSGCENYPAVPDVVN